MLFFNLDLLTPNCKTETEIGRERKNERKKREFQRQQTSRNQKLSSFLCPNKNVHKHYCYPVEMMGMHLPKQHKHAFL
jgi:cobalamin-dependent methionine synthase I